VETIWMTAAWPALRSALDGRDQRRGLHGGDEMIEEALLGALEGRTCGRLGLGVQGPGFSSDVRRLQRGIEIVVDDLEGARIGVVDADLLRSELVFHQLILDPLVRQ
jgi:hypothetical protein